MHALLKYLIIPAIAVSAPASITTAPVYAQRPVIVVENEGMRISDVGEVQEKYREELRVLSPEREVPRVGFIYRYSGLFYVDFWTSKGKYCLYLGNGYAPIDEKEAAELLGIPQGELSKPLLYRFPWGLSVIAAILLCLGIIGVVSSYDSTKHEKRFETLVNDPTYRSVILKCAERYRAAAGIDEQPEAVDDLSGVDVAAVFSPEMFEDAVNQLVEQGLGRAEASDDLRYVLGELDMKRTLAEL